MNHQGGKPHWHSLNVWSKLNPVSLKLQFFWHFLLLQSISLIFDKNIKQVNCLKALNLMALSGRYFAHLR